MRPFSWLRISGLLGLALALAACGGGGSNKAPPQDQTFEMMYATSGNKVGSFQVDASTGALGGGTTTALGPTALAVSLVADPQSQYLFVTDASTVASTASIHVFSIEASSGVLREVSGSPFSANIQTNIGAGAPAQLAADPTGHFLFLGTQYGNPNPGIEVFTVDRATGALHSTGFFGDFGLNGVFGLLVHPSGKFLYAGDNNGHLLGFAVNSGTGALTSIPGSPFATGGSVTDLVAYPSGKFLFGSVTSVTTGQPGIMVWGIDAISGALHEISTPPLAAASSCCPLLMDPGGKFLYGMQPWVRAYALDSANGTVTPIKMPQTAPGVIIFIAATLDPQGKFIFVSGGEPETLVGFSIDQSTGIPRQYMGTSALPFSPGALTLVRLP